jgi:hypothetical protein
MEGVEGAVEYKLTYDKIINYFNEPTIKQGNAVKARCIIARRVSVASPSTWPGLSSTFFLVSVVTVVVVVIVFFVVVARRLSPSLAQ